MDTRLVIFTGFVAVALIINTAMMFAAYKMLSGVSAKLIESVEKFQAGMPLREWISKMQSASEGAVKATESLKDHIVGFDPVVQRIQTSYSRTLAKTDVRFDLACRAVNYSVGVASRLVTWPFRQVSGAAAGIQVFLSFIRGSENGGNARSRRTR